MSVEQNMALARRFIEARGKADLNALEEMLAPDFITHGMLPTDQQPDREKYKRQLAEYAAAFSDLRIVIEDQVAADEKVVSRISGCAVHDRRELLGAAPTGREVHYIGIMIHRISGGKIAEEWGLGTSVSELMGQRLEQEARERERIEQELLVARRIQQASLPEEIPELEGWEMTPCYQPAREVGGDFYDFHLLSEGRLGLVIGDATGKGVPAALVMSTSCGMLRVAAQSSSSPGEVLERVNEALCPNIAPHTFVTCFYAILDPKSGSLKYANAGHDLPYLYRNNKGEQQEGEQKQAQAEELRATGMPLGLMPGMSYEEKETTLKAGEAALFYTDGIVEAHSPKGEMFGFPRLRGLVAKYGEERTLAEKLLEELYSFTGGGEGWEQEDDITLLTLRRSAVSR